MRTFLGGESTIKGDIILFRVDDDGGSAPFTLDERRKWVDKGMPTAIRTSTLQRRGAREVRGALQGE